MVLLRMKLRKLEKLVYDIGEDVDSLWNSVSDIKPYEV